MTPQDSAFYQNDVVAEDFDYTFISEDDAPELQKREGVVSRLAGGFAAFICGGVLVFGPIGLMSPLESAPAPVTAEQVVVHLNAPPGVATEVQASAYHREASQAFRHMFKVVPPNPVEERDDPDYGF